MPVDKEITAEHYESLWREFENWESEWQRCERSLPELPAALDWALDHAAPWAQSLAYNGFLLARRLGLPPQALAICRRMTACDTTNLQAWLGNHALALCESGEYAEAQILLQNQEQLCRAADDQDGLLNSYANQALVAKKLGQTKQSWMLHKKEAALCRQLGDKGALARSYGNQALLLGEMGRFEEAWELHSKEEALCRELDDQDGLQRSYGNQALIFRFWGMPEEALALLKKQEAICLALGHKAALHGCYRNQALLARESGIRDESTSSGLLGAAMAVKSGVRKR